METQSTYLLHTGSLMPVLDLGTWELTAGTADAVENALGPWLADDRHLR